MKSHEIRDQIENYFEGRSTYEEERALFDYFNKENIDNDLIPYRSYFLNLKENSAEISKMIETENTAFLHNSGSSTHHYRFKISRFIPAAAAAVIVILMSTIVLFQMQQDYVIVDGVKYTNRDKINQAFQVSLNNAKIEEDVFSFDLEDIDIE